MAGIPFKQTYQAKCPDSKEGSLGNDAPKAGNPLCSTSKICRREKNEGTTDRGKRVNKIKDCRKERAAISSNLRSYVQRFYIRGHDRQGEVISEP